MSASKTERPLAHQWESLFKKHFSTEDPDKVLETQERIMIFSEKHCDRIARALRRDEIIERIHIGDVRRIVQVARDCKFFTLKGPHTEGQWPDDFARDAVIPTLCALRAMEATK